MKKALLLGCLIAGMLCIGGEKKAFAQSDSLVEIVEPFRGELAVGIRGGYQFSRVNFDVGIVQGLQEGVNIGLILQYLSQRQIGIQLEVNYSQRGLFASTSTYRISRQFDFIEIPFMTHFAIGKKSFRIVLNAGSYLSFLARESTLDNQGTTPSYYLLPLGRKWTYGFTGGLGLALRTSIGVFQLEGRGAQGLTDLFSPSNDEVFSTAPEQFFGGQVSYLYRFGTKTTTANKPVQ